MWNGNFGDMPMQTMQNQMMNFNETNLEELIKPYQEKIRKLEDEISQKDFLITQLKFKLSQINNANKNNQQLINNTGNNMDNQFNQNQMNMMSKFLNLKFITQEGSPIFIQCNSDEKMKDTINKFFMKTSYNREEYEFFIGKEIKNEGSTIKENGILDDKNYFINVIKKNPNNANKKNEINQINNDDNKDTLNKSDIKILGTPITLVMSATTGAKARIKLGLNNTFKDVAIQFCQYLNTPTSAIGNDLIFLFNSDKLDPFNDELTLEQIGLKNDSHITVLDQGGIILKYMKSF